MTTRMKSLLDEASDSRVPEGLGECAVAGARRRRTRRFAVAGSALALAAVVLGVVVAVQAFRTSAEPRPGDVASLPAELPGTEGLPTLAEAPMAEARVAYVVEGSLVLVSASDGHVVVGGYDLPVGYESPADVYLSPDGRFALVDHYTTSVITGGVVEDIPSLIFVDVASGEVEAIGQSIVYSPSGGGLRALRLAAWAPEGDAFACVCTTSAGDSGLVVSSMDGRATPSAWPSLRNASGLSWGASGLVVSLGSSGGDWRLLETADLVDSGPLFGPPRIQGEDVVAVALSLDAPGALLAAKGDSYRVYEDARPVARGSWSGRAIAFVQAASGGYLVMTRQSGPAPGERVPPAPLDVRFVGSDGTQAELTRFPTATYSASFAAGLVGAP